MDINICMSNNMDILMWIYKNCIHGHPWRLLWISKSHVCQSSILHARISTRISITWILGPGVGSCIPLDLTTLRLPSSDISRRSAEWSLPEWLQLSERYWGLSGSVYWDGKGISMSCYLLYEYHWDWHQPIPCHIMGKGDCFLHARTGETLLFHSLLEKWILP